MTRVSLQEFRDDLDRLLDLASRDQAPVTVDLGDGRSVVVLSEEDHRGLVATVDLLGTPANAARLAESIAQLEASGGRERDVLCRP